MDKYTKILVHFKLLLNSQHVDGIRYDLVVAGLSLPFRSSNKRLSILGGGTIHLLRTVWTNNVVPAEIVRTTPPRDPMRRGSGLNHWQVQTKFSKKKNEIFFFFNFCLDLPVIWPEYPETPLGGSPGGLRTISARTKLLVHTVCTFLDILPPPKPPPPLSPIFTLI